MHFATRFQALIEYLINAHNVANPEPFQIGGQDKALVIQNPTAGIAPLRIVNICRHIVYVDQPLLSDGSPDPGAVFLVSPEYGCQWLCIGIQQLFPGHYRCYAQLNDKRTRVERYASRWLNDANTFCNGMWWDALSEQGFRKLQPADLRSAVEIIIQEDPEAFYVPDWA